MGDIGEMYDKKRAESQMKRALNRKTSREILDSYGIEYEIKNGGAHLIVKDKGLVIDFWPGTGKYIFRSGKKAGRGVLGMVRQIGKHRLSKQGGA
jgi:hypothetical protein